MDSDFRQRGLIDRGQHRAGVITETPVEQDVEQAGEETDHGGAGPERHYRAPKLARHRVILRVDRQRRRIAAAHRADHLQQALLDGFQLRAAVIHDPVTSFEAHLQAEVNQLQQRNLFTRRLRQARQQLEEFLPAPGFIVKRHQQAAARPDAAPAPRSQRGGFIQRGAQAVAGADNRFIRQPGALAVHLKLADLVDQALA